MSVWDDCFGDLQPPPRKAARLSGLVDDIVGPIGVKTPQVILDEMTTVDVIVKQIAASLVKAVPAVDADTLASWQLFADEWRQFWDDHQTLLSRMWGGTYAKTVEYRDRAAAWRTQLEQAGVKMLAPVDPRTTPLGTVLLTAAGLALAGYYYATRRSKKEPPP